MWPSSAAVDGGAGGSGSNPASGAGTPTATTVRCGAVPHPMPPPVAVCLPVCLHVCLLFGFIALCPVVHRMSFCAACFVSGGAGEARCFHCPCPCPRLTLGGPWATCVNQWGCVAWGCVAWGRRGCMGPGLLAPHPPAPHPAPGSPRRRVTTRQPCASATPGPEHRHKRGWWGRGRSGRVRPWPRHSSPPRPLGPCGGRLWWWRGGGRGGVHCGPPVSAGQADVQGTARPRLHTSTAPILPHSPFSSLPHPSSTSSSITHVILVHKSLVPHPSAPSAVASCSPCLIDTMFD
jgi:hypothetical protein